MAGASSSGGQFDGMAQWTHGGESGSEAKDRRPRAIAVFGEDRAPVALDLLELTRARLARLLRRGHAVRGADRGHAATQRGKPRATHRSCPPGCRRLAGSQGCGGRVPQPHVSPISSRFGGRDAWAAACPGQGHPPPVDRADQPRRHASSALPTQPSDLPTALVQPEARRSRSAASMAGSNVRSASQWLSSSAREFQNPTASPAA